MATIVRSIIIVFIFFILGTILRYLSLKMFPILGMKALQDLNIILLFYYIIYILIYIEFTLVNFLLKNNYLFIQSCLTGIFCFFTLFILTSLYSNSFAFEMKIVIHLLPYTILGFTYPFLRRALRVLIK
jgi:hypothetical protein